MEKKKAGQRMDWYRTFSRQKKKRKERTKKKGRSCPVWPASWPGPLGPLAGHHGRPIPAMAGPPGWLLVACPVSLVFLLLGCPGHVAGMAGPMAGLAQFCPNGQNFGHPF